MQDWIVRAGIREAEIRIRLLLISVTARNSGMVASRKTVPTKSFQSLENRLTFPGEAYIATKAN